MQQPISRRDVYAPGVSAVIGGLPVEVESVRVDRDLPDSLVGGSLSAASASLEVLEGADVARSVATPWDASSSWPPAPESSASVSMDMGDGPVSLMAGGRVVSASGGTSGRAVSVEVADAYQSLDRPISWDGVAEAMPPYLDGGERRFVGMWTPSITDMVLRRCGWFSTPPTQGFSVLSVPGQGSMWAERGTVLSSSAATVSGSYPRFGVTPWGVGTLDVNATYAVSGGYTIKSRGRVELSAMTMTTGGTGRVTAETGPSLVRLAWSDGQGVVWIGGDGMTLTAVATISRADGLLYATVEYVSDTSVKVVIRSGGAIVTNVVTVPASVTTGAVSTAGILVDGSRSGGFQVAFPSSSAGLANWVPNAVIYARITSMNRLVVRPPIEGENCADLLAQQCEAENATYWIDETGVLRWWDMARLESRSVVATLTSADDIADAGFTWSHDLSRVKSGVTVKWREAVQTLSSRHTVDLWQGSGITLQPGTAGAEEWVTAPDDEVWLMPDLTLNRVPGVSSDEDDFNRGRGSHYGAITRTSEGLDQYAQLSGDFSMTIERVSDNTFKVAASWSGTAEAVMRSPGEDSPSNLWRVRRNIDLPILRGKSKVTFADRHAVSAVTGPSTAPEMSIDAGWWIQYESQAVATANYAAARVTVPQPVLSSVDLVPVPGLQLGDNVRIVDSDVTRLTIEGVVVSDSRSIDSGMSLSHSVSVRPLTVTRNSVTWSEWAQEARPKSWREWYLNQQSTWAEWGSAPLAKE